MIDFLIGEVINQVSDLNKKGLHAIKILTDIKNMIYSWKYNIEHDKEDS